MRISFPHMGTMHIVLKTLFEGLGVEVIVPPPVTKSTLEIGTAHSPETACLPFKITLGNFVQALEGGADTIVTCGGSGPCRLGHYANIQKSILTELGYDFNMIIIEPEAASVWQALRRLNAKLGLKPVYLALRQAINKLIALDSVQRQVFLARPREVISGSVDRLSGEAIAALTQAHGKAEIDKAQKNFCEKLHTIELDYDRDIVRVGIIGEIYVSLEPFVNQDVAKILGRLGAEVHQPQLLGDYVNAHILRNHEALRFTGKVHEMAGSYIRHYVGGHGAKNIGFAAKLGEDDFDGFIHVFPFTCMPEVIAHNILPRVSKAQNIPGLSLSFDEQTGAAGITTRVEAFIDLLKYNRSRKIGDKLFVKQAGNKVFRGK